MKYDTQEARISGVWELNKSKFPLKIYLIGQNGAVTVRVSEKNINKPLGSNAKPYYNTFETQTDAQYVPYWSPDTNGVLSIDVIPAEGTIVKSISFGGTAQEVGS